jgi:hypothetical protein
VPPGGEFSGAREGGSAVTIDRDPYEGVHAFVFIDHSEVRISEVVDELARHREGSPRVHWAGSVVGEYLAFAHIWAEHPNAFEALEDFIDTELWNAGVHCKKTTELLVVNGKPTKYATPAVLALVGIKTQHGHAMSVMEQLETIDNDHEGGWLQGASLVSGHLDIVLQLNADTFEGAQQRLLDPELAKIHGIAWTSTAIANGLRGPFADS